MSKKSKAASKEKNRVKKKAIKMANKARYQEMRKQGQNSKSFRARKAAKGSKKVHSISHPNGRCQNIGCKHCNEAALSLPRVKTLSNSDRNIRLILNIIRNRKKAA